MTETRITAQDYRRYDERAHTLRAEETRRLLHAAVLGAKALFAGVTVPTGRARSA
ncbi:MAG: hypothetical protein AAFQ88_05465 [Pseudomonadota bacterium]